MTSKRTSCLALALSCLGVACGDDGSAADTTAPPDGGTADAVVDTGPVDAGPLPSRLARFCAGRDYASTLRSAVLDPLEDEPIGFIDSTPGGDDLEPGTTESITITPAHPFIVRNLRVAFAQGTGTARIRLVESFGRSYPASFLGISDTGDVDVVPPVEIDVDVVTPDEWIDVDVSGAEAVLMPGRVYHLVYEHLTPEPFLTLERVPEGEANRSVVLFPGDVSAYGVPGNFRMVAEGDYACAWSDEMRWLERAAPETFAPGPGGNVHVADLDGDGNDDVVAVGSERPVVYFGDGGGGFTRAADGVFPDDEVKAHHMVFADVDGDGDQDAVVMVYIQSDADGDGVAVTEGDCDDTLSGIRPGGVERPNNGFDDDCDGVVDDGASTDDADGDGLSIATGDCNDRDAEILPGAVEDLDGRDDDCDGRVDEDFFHHVLLNDGDGRFTRLPGAGIEVQGPTAASGMADADGDGNLDLFVGFWLRHYPDAPTERSLFYYGNGDGTFREATEEAGLTVGTPRPVYGVMWNDWNDDGRDDLYVGHYQLNDNLFFANDGTGRFTDVARSIGVDHDGTPTIDFRYPGGHSYGGDFGDLDGDGDLDAILCNLSHPRTMPWADPTMLVFNEGAPGYAFTDQREDWGIEYNEGDGNAHFGDFDNDGDLDVVIASFYGRYQRAFRHDGDHFTDVTYELGIQVRSGVTIWSDLDADGRLDYVSSDGDETFVYMNRVQNDNAWIELLLEGAEANRDAIGARVTVVAGGRTLVREVRPNGGLSNRQGSRWVHVGLGEVTEIDSLTVRWPGGGATEAIAGASPNGRFVVRQGSGAATAE